MGSSNCPIYMPSSARIQENVRVLGSPQNQISWFVLCAGVNVIDLWLWQKQVFIGTSALATVAQGSNHFIKKKDLLKNHLTIGLATTPTREHKA